MRTTAALYGQLVALWLHCHILRDRQKIKHRLTSDLSVIHVTTASCICCTLTPYKPDARADLMKWEREQEKGEKRREGPNGGSVSSGFGYKVLTHKHSFRITQNQTNKTNPTPANEKPYSLSGGSLQTLRYTNTPL